MVQDIRPSAPSLFRGFLLRTRSMRCKRVVEACLAPPPPLSFCLLCNLLCADCVLGFLPRHLLLPNRLCSLPLLRRDRTDLVNSTASCTSVQFFTASGNVRADVTWWVLCCTRPNGEIHASHIHYRIQQNQAGHENVPDAASAGPVCMIGPREEAPAARMHKLSSVRHTTVLC